MIKFTKKEEEKIINNMMLHDKKFIVKYNNIYQLNYSKNAGLQQLKVFTNYDKLPLTKKGRFFIMTASEVNSLLEKEIFV